MDVDSTYLKVTNNLRVISFDSGEKSPRSNLVKKAINHLLNTGNKVVVFAEINPAKTMSYFRLLPSLITSQVLSLGSYHRYLNFAKRVRSTLEEFYYDQECSKTLVYLLDALRELLAVCITSLLAKGYYIILDRSFYSTLAYQCYAMHASKTDATKLAQSFNPGLSVFVLSEIDLPISSKTPLYRQWASLDQKVKTCFRSIYEVKKAKGAKVHLYSDSPDADEAFSKYLTAYLSNEL